MAVSSVVVSWCHALWCGHDVIASLQAYRGKVAMSTNRMVLSARQREEL